jgi:hypothetical protein
VVGLAALGTARSLKGLEKGAVRSWWWHVALWLVLLLLALRMHL